MNSVLILLAFIAFTLFGYLSLVRIAYKQLYVGQPLAPRELGRHLFAAGGMTLSLLALGQSFIFLGLPAVSLMLFWGWGPALLWLLIFHLLGESMHYLLSTRASGNSELSPPTRYLAPVRMQGGLLNLLAQLLLCICIAIAAALMAGLLDQQPGLVFALAGSLLAISLIKQNLPLPAALSRGSLCLAVLSGGLVFAHNLGISVYGSWAPLPEQAPWLEFNNASLITMGLLWAAFRLVTEIALVQNLAKVVGLIILALAAVLLLHLLWQQPPLDAPLHSSQLRSADLPMFGGLSLFLFAGTVNLWLRLISPLPAESPANLIQHLGISALQLLIFLLVCLALAAALGIGAWNTHYVDWGAGQDFRLHFGLAYDAVQTLAGVSGAAGQISHTLFVIAFCLIGFSFSAFCVGKLRLLHRIANTESGPDPVSRSAATVSNYVAIHIVGIFLLTCWFLSNGISLDVWITVCMLSWLLLVVYQLMYLASLPQDNAALLPAGALLGFFALGCLQLLWSMVARILSQDWPMTIVAGLILITALSLCWRPCLTVTRRFKPAPEPAVFEPPADE